MPPEITIALNVLREAMALLGQLKAKGRRTGELTPEQDAELDRQVNEEMKKPHWTG